MSLVVTRVESCIRILDQTLKNNMRWSYDFAEPLYRILCLLLESIPESPVSVDLTPKITDRYNSIKSKVKFVELNDPW